MNKQIANYTPKVFKGFLIYDRAEENGTHTIKTMNSGIPTKIINETFYEVLSYCDGTKSIETIVDIMSLKYQNINRKNIEKDIMFVIKNLLNMQALENSYLINKIPNKYNKLDRVHRIEICDFSSLSSLKTFCNSIKNHFFTYQNVKENISNFDLAILNKENIYNSPTYIFKILKKDEIVGIISWRLHFQNIIYLDCILINNPLINIQKCILKTLMLVHYMTGGISNIFRIFTTINEDNRYYFLAGFKETGNYHKEIDNKLDLIELSKYL